MITSETLTYVRPCCCVPSTPALSKWGLLKNEETAAAASKGDVGALLLRASVLAAARRPPGYSEEPPAPTLCDAAALSTDEVRYSALFSAIQRSLYSAREINWLCHALNPNPPIVHLTPLQLVTLTLTLILTLALDHVRGLCR